MTILALLLSDIIADKQVHHKSSLEPLAEA